MTPHVQRIVDGLDRDGKPLDPATHAAYLAEFRRRGLIDGAPAAAPSRPPTSLELPCVHQGEQVRTFRCAPCQRREGLPPDVPAYACALHGECALMVTLGVKRPKHTCSSCRDYQPAGVTPATPTWIVGITTAPRETPTLEQTVNSVIAAGWHPILYAEPETDIECVSAPVVRNGEALGPWKNWIKTAERLLLADTSHILILQDDILLSPDSRKLVEETPWPRDIGCRSLYTEAGRNRRKDGRHELRARDFRGALGLAFPSHVLRRLLNTPTVKTWNKPANIDTAIGKAMAELGLKIDGFSPSLGQHIGETSTIWTAEQVSGRRAVRRKAKRWRGNDSGPFEPVDVLLVSGERREGSAVLLVNDATAEERAAVMAALAGRGRYIPAKPVSIVIPARDGLDLTKRCLDAVADHSDLPVEIVYADDESEPGTIEAVESHARTLGLTIRSVSTAEPAGVLTSRRLIGQHGAGFTVAANLGIQAAIGDEILLLNNDAFLQPGCLSALVTRLRLYQRMAAVGPRGCGNDKAVYGWCCLMRREAIADVGLFDECAEFPNGLGTDDDWCKRASLKGWRVAVVPDANCEHLRSQTFQRLGIDRVECQRIAQVRLKCWNREPVGPRPHEVDVPAPTPTVFHLLYHLTPFADNDGWLKNVRQIRKRFHLFNGRKVLALTVDPQCVPPEEIEPHFPGFQIIPCLNDPRLRECATFPALMGAVEREPGATFYAHGKGVRSIGNPQGIVWWRNLMYRELLDDFDRVKRALSVSPIVGAYRMIECPPYPDLMPRSPWQFAGTFFWFRNRDVFSRDWQGVLADSGWGVEAWPGRMFPFEQSRCLTKDKPWDVYNPATYREDERINDD